MDEIVINGYMSRDKNNALYFSTLKPVKSDYAPVWNRTKIEPLSIHQYKPFDVIRIPKDKKEFLQIKWEDEEPKEAKIIISLKHKG